MKEAQLIIKEQASHFYIILRLSKYEEKASYQSHYLGLLWQILNPLIQIAIYYMIFGLGVNGGKLIQGTPFIVWLMIGITCWLFINASVLGASNSIYRNVGLVTKMKFPISLLPAISITGNAISFCWMFVLTILLLFGAGIYPTIYWLQLLYYLPVMLLFLFSIGLFNATITTLVRDYQLMIQSMMRVIFYVSGAIWDVDNKNLPEGLVKCLKLNPFYYLIEGVRDSLLSRGWFWEKANYTCIFWLMMIIIFVIGSHLNLKFRAKFSDYV